MNNRLNVSIRRNRGLKLKSYFKNLLNNSGIYFLEENVIDLEKTDVIIENIVSIFAKKQTDDELIIFETPERNLAHPTFELLKTNFGKTNGYLLTDVYEYCGIYKETFSLLLDNFSSLILNSNEGTCMLLDENYNTYLTGNLNENNDKQSLASSVEVMVKYKMEY